MPAKPIPNNVYRPHYICELLQIIGPTNCIISDIIQKLIKKGLGSNTCIQCNESINVLRCCRAIIGICFEKSNSALICCNRFIIGNENNPVSNINFARISFADSFCNHEISFLQPNTVYHMWNQCQGQSLA